MPSTTNNYNQEKYSNLNVTSAYETGNVFSKIYPETNQSVGFKKENGVVYVSATDMAKSFGKRPNDYLALPSTNELINAITRKSGIAENQLVIIYRGGLNPGTWLHEDVALDYAQWLSMDFKLWCNDRIKELLRFGMTALPQTIDDLVQNPDLLIQICTQLKEERRQKELAQEAHQSALRDLHYQEDIVKHQKIAIHYKDKMIEDAAPKVQFFNAVADSLSTIDISEAAKVLNLGIGRNKLFEFLRKHKILMHNNQPYQKYVDAGYFKIIDVPITHKGETKIYTKTVIFQRGLDFIFRKYTDLNSLQNN